jgi:uncharacterized protein DUF1843
MADEYQPKPSHVIPLYAVPIQEAVASGDVQRMKGLVTHAEEYVKTHSEIAGAVEKLKAEIARLEHK